MRKSILILLCVSGLAACTSPKQEDSAQATESGEPAAMNQLSEQQKGDGWKALFNGQSMDGWRIYKNKENDSWEVTEGTLHCKPFKEGVDNKRSDLITTEQYENFELVFDWKISPQGNSGVMYRVTEEFDQPYASGPEYQLLDDTGYPGEVKDVQLTAGNYDMEVATNKKLNPAGEWNTAKIVVNKNQVEHWLNGTKVLAYELGSPDWQKRKSESKWKDFPGYGLAAKGHIDLQDHGNEAWFRNIFIKTL